MGNIPTIKKIITHASIFHADEVLAIALLRHYGITAQVERKFQVSDEELADKEILVLDVAKNYDPSCGNFDHHQDGDIVATNVLIANWLVYIGLMPVEVRANLNTFLSYVSDVDRGVIPNGGSPVSFNGIIRSMNTASKFEDAIALATQVVYDQIAVATKAISNKKIWEKLERICNGQVAVQKNIDNMAGWKDLAKKDGVKFLVTPNARGGWQIISRDSVIYTIPIDIRQNFCHTSGFMAAYDIKEDAIDHACEMAEIFSV